MVIKLKKIMITGAYGQVGFCLTQQAQVNGWDVLAIDRDKLDITDLQAVNALVKEYQPDVIINAAAHTAVDKAETEIDASYAINREGPKYLAEAAASVGAAILHISTDYVFDGLNLKAYVETDKPNPINIYGKSKSIGENNIREIHEKSAVIRTSWLYSEFENNFATTIIKKLFKNEELKVVDDQIGNPTNIYELSNQLESIINNEICGIIHCSSEGETSWYCYAKKIAELINIKANISPIKTEQLSRLAKRPKYSSLQNKVLNDNKINEMSQWENALEKFIINYIK